MYNGVPPSPSGARISSCLCAPFRAFRFARPYLGRHPGCFAPRYRAWCGGLRERQAFPANLHLAMNSKRKREATAILSWLPLHNRPAGGLLKVPGFVGTRSTDFVCKIALSTTLFQKIGVLRGGTPKPGFAYFCLAAKVGRAGARNAPPPEGRRPSSPAVLPKPAYDPQQRQIVPGGHEISPAPVGWKPSLPGSASEPGTRPCQKRSPPAGKRTAPQRFA